MPSACAIARFDLPCAINAAVSRSRCVRPPCAAFAARARVGSGAGGASVIDAGAERGRERRVVVELVSELDRRARATVERSPRLETASLAEWIAPSSASMRHSSGRASWRPHPSRAKRERSCARPSTLRASTNALRAQQRRARDADRVVIADQLASDAIGLPRRERELGARQREIPFAERAAIAIRRRLDRARRHECDRLRRAPSRRAAVSPARASAIANGARGPSDPGRGAEPPRDVVRRLELLARGADREQIEGDHAEHAARAALPFAMLDLLRDRERFARDPQRARVLAAPHQRSARQ